jgi:serine phosphatase RsbU (regulator of sigma subunit)
MKLAEANGYKKTLAEVYKFIGFIYRPNEPNIAIEYYGKSLRIHTDIGNERGASYLLSAIGNVYEGTTGLNKEENSKLALDYYLKSLEIRERVGVPPEIASSLNETSRVYERMGQHNKAEELRKKGLAIAEKSGSIDNIIYFCNLIGQDFSNKHDYVHALPYMLKAYKIIQHEPNISFSMRSDVAHGLALTYLAMNDYKKSAEYYQLYISCNDSINARTNTVNFNNLKNILATEREKEHLLLKDAEIDKQKAIVDKQIILRNAFIGGFVLVIALVIFILRGYRQKQKANYQLDLNNKKIEHAYKIIEEKTKSITDSIHYALRIQRAALPHRSEIWANLKHSFVLYKPKDIVSGDFYWFDKKGEQMIIAAADCTGHGVPGAIMSIIGSERLTDAVQAETEPGKILSMLNVGIKTSLRQSESAESTKDGMDIALCTVDIKTNIITYAGANRPLWVIRKNAKEIEEIKANKVSIGGLTANEQCFDTHTVQLNTGDTFYIFSDGYIDQFGGEKGKKLTTKKFKEILLGIQHLEMKDQEKQLADFIDGWKVNTEQVDDILIIGVKM